jgi:cation diffusion facilitator CzcD-associated flavoprotein CzcO
MSSGGDGVAVVGAGPFGLAVTAHLRAAGVPTATFGEPMAYWERNMPAGMFLRSPWRAAWIASPDHRLSLARYEREIGRRLARPVPIDDFIAYGHWFQREAAPDVDRRRVRLIERSDEGFSLTLQDGDVVRARRVVLATGLANFERRPAPFDALPSTLVSHTADHADLGTFNGRRVLVVGAGQSAIESAAIAREHGAEVQVLVRRPVHWLTRSARLHRAAKLAGRVLYAPHDIGPAGLSWVVAPRLARRTPSGLRGRMTVRCIRPAAASWLLPRLTEVPIVTARDVEAASAKNGHVDVSIDGGRVLSADHVLLGTGFRPDLMRVALLAPGLAAGIRTVAGQPVLNRGFETSVPGLHAVGALAAYSFGPVMRFVAGTWYTAPAVARVIARSGDVRVPARPWVTPAAAEAARAID